MPNVMLDLETLDNTPSSVVLSLGAVCDADPSNTFHMHLELEPQTDVGCTISTSTVMWWLGQNETARADQANATRVHPQDALHAFADWLGQFEDTKQNPLLMWGNGASFDVPIVRHEAMKFGVQMPWKFWNERCYRTLKNLFPNIKAPSKNQHTALGDALNQLLHLQYLLDAVKSPTTFAALSPAQQKEWSTPREA